MKRKKATNCLNCLEVEYRKVRLHRIALEVQFEAVDGSEMISANTRDKWWQMLESYREREQLLEFQIFRFQRQIKQSKRFEPALPLSA